MSFEPSAPNTPTFAPDSIGSIVADAINRAVTAFQANDPIATGNVTPQALHDARVALRRLRSTLRTFRALFDPTWAASVRAELAWFGGLLGAIRQVDIIGEHLRRYREWQDDEAAHELFTIRMDLDRRQNMNELMVVETTDRYRATLHHLEVAASFPPFTADATEVATSAMERTLQRPWRDLRDAGRRAQKTLDESDLHAMRIRAKELRYATELAAIVHGPQLSRVGRAASKIQDRLGDHRDALITVGFLEQLARTDLAAGFLGGQLVVQEREFAQTTLVGLTGDLRRLKRRWLKVKWNRTTRQDKQSRGNEAGGSIRV